MEDRFVRIQPWPTPFYKSTVCAHCYITCTCPPVLFETCPSSTALQSVPLILTRDTVTLKGE